MFRKPLVAITLLCSLYSSFGYSQSDSSWQIQPHSPVYAEQVAKYRQGIRDSSSLRELAIAAHHRKDISLSRDVANEFIKNLKDPSSKDNLRFIFEVTSNTNDPGFSILMSNMGLVDSLNGANSAMNKLKAIIFNSEVKKYVSNSELQPNWDEIEKRIIPKYGAPGKAIFLKAKAINCLEHEQWNHFVTAVEELSTGFDNELSDNELNNFAWAVFENMKDSTLLKMALAWSNRIQKTGVNTMYLDTKANLLYKLGETDLAIEMQKEAVRLNPNELALRNNLDLMTKGMKTWK